MLCHLLTKLELTASASMAQRLTDDKVFQWVNIQLMHTTLKNVELLKHFKISKTAPTCFGL